jgi:hypothetical protein
MAQPHHPDIPIKQTSFSYAELASKNPDAM